MDLSISNVVNISVSQAGAGAGEYNTSNLSIFTHEPYNAGTFGVDAYKIYRESTSVAIDFGTDSDTYKMAVKVFSQSINILANSGYLVIIPLVSEKQLVAFDVVPDSGDFKFTYNAVSTAAIPFSATFGDVQTALRLVAGLEDIVVTGDFTAGFVLDFQGVEGNIANISITDNNLLLVAAAVVITVSESEGGETLDEAIVRSESIVQYFGILVTYILGSVELSAVGNTIQAMSKLGFFGSNQSADIDPDGDFDLIRQASLTHTRCLYYGSIDISEVIGFTAAYAGRALSTNFSGSNTTQTMHLKDLAGVIPDSTMSENLLQKAKDAGADTYISIQGVPKVFTSGANDFFDNIYNLLWFVGDLQIAGFNTLAQTGTKIAQTEEGVDTIKSSYRKICEKARSNQFIAAGSWTSPDKFGVLEDFNNNILERGYYIYSAPVGLQTSAEREARKAPLIQIAVKYAGAIHSSNVIVNINK